MRDAVLLGGTATGKVTALGKGGCGEGVKELLVYLLDLLDGFVVGVTLIGEVVDAFVESVF